MSNLRFALGAIALLFLAFPARAGVPEWLRLAAQQPVPAHGKDVTAVILLDEELTTVKSSGEIQTLYRRAYRILRPQGRDYAHVVVPFSNDTRLTYLKAWAISPKNDEYEVKEKEAVETGMLAEALYSDDRVKVLSIPGADPGSTLGYEYVQKRRPFVLQDEWEFQFHIPVARARLTVELPDGWSYRTQWANHRPENPESAGKNRWVWELADLPAVEVEPVMPPWRAVAGRMGIIFLPASGTAGAQLTWNDIGKWYAGLVVSSRTPTPEIQQKVAELTAGSHSTVERIRALTTFLQRQIRYVAIEIGIGGYQPHPATMVFQSHYGDCKDKVTLLSTMLAALGIRSYYVVVNAERGYVLPDFPSLANFDHMIIAIHLPDDAPEGELYALVKHPALGRLLIFDPTDEYTPVGYLPESLQQSKGLLVTDDGGELIDLPLLPPSANRLSRTAKLSLSGSGDLTGEVHEMRWGSPAIERRASLLSSSRNEQKKYFEEFLGVFLSRFTLDSATVGNLDQFDLPLQLDYSFAAQSYAKSAGPMLLLRPRVFGEKGSSILSGEPRKYPIEFTDASVQTDLFEITLPAGYKVEDLPPPVSVDYDFGNYSSQVEVQGGVLRYKRNYSIKQVIVPVSRLDDLKKFFSQIAADERMNVVLSRSEQ